MEDITIKPLTLEIDKKVWEKYKLTVPRGKSLNQSIVDLIEEKLKKVKDE